MNNFNKNQFISELNNFLISEINNNNIKKEADIHFFAIKYINSICENTIECLNICKKLGYNNSNIFLLKNPGTLAFFSLEQITKNELNYNELSELIQ